MADDDTSGLFPRLKRLYRRFAFPNEPADPASERPDPANDTLGLLPPGTTAPVIDPPQPVPPPPVPSPQSPVQPADAHKAAIAGTMRDGRAKDEINAQAAPVTPPERAEIEFNARTNALLAQNARFAAAALNNPAHPTEQLSALQAADSAERISQEKASLTAKPEAEAAVPPMVPLPAAEPATIAVGPPPATPEQLLSMAQAAADDLTTRAVSEPTAGATREATPAVTAILQTEPPPADLPDQLPANSARFADLKADHKAIDDLEQSALDAARANFAVWQGANRTAVEASDRVADYPASGSLDPDSVGALGDVRTEVFEGFQHAHAAMRCLEDPTPANRATFARYDAAVSDGSLDDDRPTLSSLSEPELASAVVDRIAAYNQNQGQEVLSQLQGVVADLNEQMAPAPEHIDRPQTAEPALTTYAVSFTRSETMTTTAYAADPQQAIARAHRGDEASVDTAWTITSSELSDWRAAPATAADVAAERQAAGARVTDITDAFDDSEPDGLSQDPTPRPGEQAFAVERTRVETLTALLPATSADAAVTRARDGVERYDMAVPEAGMWSVSEARDTDWSATPVRDPLIHPINDNAGLVPPSFPVDDRSSFQHLTDTRTDSIVEDLRDAQSNDNRPDGRGPQPSGNPQPTPAPEPQTNDPVASADAEPTASLSPALIAAATAPSAGAGDTAEGGDRPGLSPILIDAAAYEAATAQDAYLDAVMIDTASRAAEAQQISAAAYFTERAEPTLQLRPEMFDAAAETSDRGLSLAAIEREATDSHSEATEARANRARNSTDPSRGNDGLGR